MCSDVKGYVENPGESTVSHSRRGTSQIGQKRRQERAQETVQSLLDLQRNRVPVNPRELKIS